MDNPFFDAWFSAQARDPNSFVVDICSTEQIDTYWQQWVDDTTPQQDNHAVHFGTNNAMQHVKAALRHRVFRDKLRPPSAVPSSVAPCRYSAASTTLTHRWARFQLHCNLTYYLAHPSAKSWMAKFKVQHDLSLAPSYVKPL